MRIKKLFPNKRKVLSAFMLAALPCVLSLSISSCKDDDDDDNKREEQVEQEAHEQATAFWSIVGQLVSVDDVTDDYEGKTFEPTYGMADEQNPLARIVNTNDMKTAAQRSRRQDQCVRAKRSHKRISPHAPFRP